MDDKDKVKDKKESKGQTEKSWRVMRCNGRWMSM